MPYTSQQPWIREADDFITYDHRQGLDAEAAGLSIVAPGFSA